MSGGLACQNALLLANISCALTLCFNIFLLKHEVNIWLKFLYCKKHILVHTYINTILNLLLDTANTCGPLPNAISTMFFLHKTSTFLGSKLLWASPWEKLNSLMRWRLLLLKIVGVSIFLEKISREKKENVCFNKLLANSYIKLKFTLSQ